MLAFRHSGLLKAILQAEPICVRAVATASWKVPKPTMQERIATWDYVNSIYFGPERDLKNFPNPKQPETSEPVRLGIIPAKWFDFFYPKTGFSGGYVFTAGLALWMMSKEIMVIEENFWQIPGFWGMIYFFHKHPMGQKLNQALKDKTSELEQIHYHRAMNKSKQSAEDALAALERLVEELKTVDFVRQTMQEGVELQLEAAYRQRLLTAYQEVKKRLDYEVEKENLKRKFEQDHMVNWIVSSVTKGITPQQEAESIKSCIETLKKLASKRQATATA